MVSQLDNIYLPKLYTDALFINIPKKSIHTKCSSKLANSNKLTELAENFQLNWTKHRNLESTDMDDSLTNLNWLHNVNSIIGPQSSSSLTISLLNHSSVQSLPIINNMQKNTYFPPTKQTDHAPIQAQSSLVHHLDSALKDGGLLDPIVRYDYKNNWSGKPPFSYATLICMAMRELNKCKITLADIYSWIIDNFIYYRLSDSSWQNSVRHNLSLNKCFEKVPRNKDERGKGGFWKINPKYADRLESNLIKYRRQFPVSGVPKISNGLPAASTLLSRDPDSYQIYENQQYAIESTNTDNGWYNSNCNSCIGNSHLNVPESSWNSKDDVSFLPNISTSNYSNMIAPCAFNNPNRYVTSPTESEYIRKHCSKASPTIRNPHFLKLQSLDQFRTSETGQKVDTQLRTDISSNNSPTMYSLLQQINSSPSHLSFDDFDSAASSSFDADLTANSGSSATYYSHCEDREDLIRVGTGMVDDFMVSSEDYLACELIRSHDNIFSQFI